jgi:hypothetical protein
MALQWATWPAKKVLEVFLLREPEKVVAGRTALQREKIARYHAAALRRIRAARELHYSDGVSALALYREASVFLIVALGQCSRTEEIELPSSPAEAWNELDGYLVPLTDGSRPEGLARAREVLASRDPLAPDGLSPLELSGAVAAAAETVDWLASTIEPRTPREIKASRGVRIGSGVASLAAVGALVAFGLAPKNIALNMQAVASSWRPGSPVATGVDNGEVEQTYGVHTNIEENPWVRIDLGAVVPVHEVRVFNRGDGYESEILPLLLQLSDDGEAFTDVGERTELFTRDRPWITKLEGKAGRYVRIYMPKEGYIALSEIEVY